MEKSNIPVDRWVAASSGSSLVVTTSMPKTICTQTTIAAIIAVLRAGFIFLAEYAEVAKMSLAVMTHIILSTCSKKYFSEGRSKPFGQSGQSGHDSPWCEAEMYTPSIMTENNRASAANERPTPTFGLEDCCMVDAAVTAGGESCLRQL